MKTKRITAKDVQVLRALVLAAQDKAHGLRAVAGAALDERMADELGDIYAALTDVDTLVETLWGVARRRDALRG